ncbi:unnamed protein product [Blepharisma stoltei]|uniref:Translin-associated factor X-interacting protein 1 N-terminal domain-containing protein n=1 Tax=Blepharisma stoltei TaxID=1481888 RepID=A0AAU9IM25_9CILI|nr:unnamed protein product [Blepharisma stoltei]
MSLYKTFSQSCKASPQATPDNPIYHQNQSPINLTISPSSITLPKHKKNAHSTTSPYEIPLLIKKNKPKTRTKINSDFSKSFAFSKLSSSSHSLNASFIMTPDPFPNNQRGDSTDSTLSSIDKNREILALEYRLFEKINNNSPISYGKFQAYQDVWDELLLISNPLTKILVSIKKGYEEWIEYQAKELKIKADLLKSHSEDLEQEKLSVKLLTKRFKKLASENLNLNTALKDKDITIEELNVQIDMLMRSNRKIKSKLKKSTENFKKEMDKNREERDKVEQKIKELSENLQFYKNLLKSMKPETICVEEGCDNKISRKFSSQSMISNADSLNRPLTTSFSIETLNDIDRMGSDLIYSPTLNNSPDRKDFDTCVSGDTSFREQNLWENSRYQFLYKRD